jgi:predicted ATP-grasp superfamily ATP-dependent carboligase
MDDVESYAVHGNFPVVAKNVDPWERLRSPAVGGTTVLDSPSTLRRLAASWPEQPKVMLQEYIPRHHAEDWIFHGYCDHDAQARVAFTGVKVRSWPPNAGVTTCAVTVPNDTLAEQASRFCRDLGFRGVVDLDWRFDKRDGRFKLVDFNPRLGAQFRLFQTEAGIDVVRAMHLDMTGSSIPNDPPVTGRRFIVEHLDAAARLAYQPAKSSSVSDHCHSRTEFAWISWDDPVPTVAMATRLLCTVLTRILRRVRQLAPTFRHANRKPHSSNWVGSESNWVASKTDHMGLSSPMSGGLPS